MCLYLVLGQKNISKQKWPNLATWWKAYRIACFLHEYWTKHPDLLYLIDTVVWQHSWWLWWNISRLSLGTCLLPAISALLCPLDFTGVSAAISGYDLIRVRENAESVAFFEGGTAEWSKFTALFDGLLMLSWFNRKWRNQGWKRENNIHD